MNIGTESILGQLDIVRAERARRSTDLRLGLRVERIKAYQQGRFVETYADLLKDPRYASACRFFLDDLYGPGDQSVRDSQFARIVPTLCRLFPDDVVATVDALARLHAVSEQLDSEMAANLASDAVTPTSYSTSWRRTGGAKLRGLQLELLLSVGHALQLYTRRPLMRQALRSMRVPARLAGLSDLHRFLERGFTIFGAMASPQEFLAHIELREREYAQRQFDNQY